MRKISKKGLTRKLDRICSGITRAKGECAKCRNPNYSKLETAHIFSRVYRSVRWDLDNLVCLCRSCHRYFHRNPTLFKEFIQEYLGDYKYESLKSRRFAVKKWSLQEMQDYYEILRGIHL